MLNPNAEYFSYIQNWCISQIPSQSVAQEPFAAFLCGKNIQNPFLKELLVQTGLIHLLVVSGGHFVFILTQLRRFKNKSLVVEFLLFVPLLFVFAVMTGFQAPVARAFISLILSYPISYYRLHWTQGQTQLATGFLTLSLFPEWYFSFSFYLSWLCSLALCFSTLIFRYDGQTQKSWQWITFNWLITCFLVQAIVSVFFWSFSTLSLLMNFFVAPILMSLLWPLGLSLIIYPPNSYWIDPFWKSIEEILIFFTQAQNAGFFKQVNTSEVFQQNTNWNSLWGCLILIHLFYEVLHRFRFRGNHV